MSNLTRNQLSRMERALRARQAVLRAEIREALLRSDQEHHKDLAGIVHDAGDEAVANMLADVDIAAIDRDIGELREIEGALTRLGGSKYGVCADCGGAIGFVRLKASPAAARCIDCQRRRERAAHSETPSL